MDSLENIANSLMKIGECADSADESLCVMIKNTESKDGKWFIKDKDIFELTVRNMMAQIDIIQKHVTG